MAVFDNGFYHSMDQGYYNTPVNCEEAVDTTQSRPKKLGVNELGKTVIDGPNAGRFTQSITAAIREGGSRFELQPIPSQGGGGGGDVDEYGYEEREEIKALAKINKVELTSLHVHHNTVNNLSGQTREGFSEQQRYNSIEEIRRHMNFAADALDGGSIVVHTAEFPRSISQGDEIKKEGLFEGYPGEDLEAVHTLINPKTGQVMNIKEDQEVWVPRPLKDKNGKRLWLTDANGQPVIDEFFESYFGPEEFKKKKKENPERFYVPLWAMDENNNIITEKLSFQEWKKKPQNQGKSEREVLKGFFKFQQQEQIQSSLGQAREFEQHYINGIKDRTKILDALKFYQKLKEELPPEEHHRLKQMVHQRYQFVTPEMKDPEEYLKEQLDANTRMIAYGRETSASGRTRARQIQDMVETIETIDEYALKKSANTLAELGVHAMKVTKEKHTKKDIFLTPENMLPEMGYGAHPKELMKIVLMGRKAMIERLRKKRIRHPSLKLDENNKPIMIDNPDYDPNISDAQAKEFAERHLKATLDTAHMGQWYKHFKTKQGETEEKRLARFRKWYKESVKELADKKIVGNIHLVDTFGAAHTHLAAGKGILGDTLIEAVEYLKSKGVDSISSEASGDLREIMTGTWEAFGSPLYSLARNSAPMPATFNDIRNSYFGRTNVPNYVFGAYVPSEDWTLWSGVPFE